MTEYEYAMSIGRTNKVYKSYIGLDITTIVPPAIQRNIFENPGWYTTHLIKRDC
jgi:glycine dehydrogenase